MHVGQRIAALLQLASRQTNWCTASETFCELAGLLTELQQVSDIHTYFPA